MATFATAERITRKAAANHWSVRASQSLLLLAKGSRTIVVCLGPRGRMLGVRYTDRDTAERQLLGPDDLDKLGAVMTWLEAA